MLVRYGDISGFIDDLNDGDIDGMHLSSEWHDGETGHDAGDTIDEFLDESSMLHGRKHGIYLYEHKCHWGVSEDPDLPVVDIAKVLAWHQTVAVEYLYGNVEIIPIYAMGDVLTCEQLSAFDTPQVGWAYATRDDIDSWYGDAMSGDSFVVRSRLEDEVIDWDNYQHDNVFVVTNVGTGVSHMDVRTSYGSCTMHSDIRAFAADVLGNSGFDVVQDIAPLCSSFSAYGIGFHDGRNDFTSVTGSI